MRVRKILLIHPSRSIRALIKKYIFAELSDIDIIEANNGEHALDQIGTSSFDVIVSTDQLKDMDVAELKSSQESTSHNGNTPLIVISESESNHDRNKLVQRGFDQVVQIRLRPADLIKKINAVCNPRDWRKDARYYIPNTTVIFSDLKNSIKASLINISMGGMYVELVAEEPCELMKGQLMLELQLSLPECLLAIDGLTAKLVRFEVVNWNLDHIPKSMRATFIFINLKPGTKGKLAELIMMAQEDKVAAKQVRD